MIISCNQGRILSKMHRGKIDLHVLHPGGQSEANGVVTFASGVWVFINRVQRIVVFADERPSFFTRTVLYVDK